MRGEGEVPIHKDKDSKRQDSGGCGSQCGGNQRRTERCLNLEAGGGES